MRNITNQRNKQVGIQQKFHIYTTKWFISLYNQTKMETTLKHSNLISDIFMGGDEGPNQKQFGTEEEKKSIGKISINIEEFQGIHSNQGACKTYWKINHFIDFQNRDVPLNSPTLSHITSFGKDVMENHGKRLSQAYLDLFPNQKAPKHLIPMQKGIEKLNPEMHPLDYLLPQLKKLSKYKVEFLKSQETKCIEIKLLILQLVKRIPQDKIENALLLLECMLRYHDEQQLSGLNEKKIREYMEEHEEEICDQIQNRLKEQLGDMMEMENIIGTWIQGLFLGIRGVYDLQKREIAWYQEDSDSQSVFWNSRKMIKLE